MDSRLLRAQMKSKISGGDHMSGKDKAKLLKTLRGKEKEKEKSLEKEEIVEFSTQNVYSPSNPLTIHCFERESLETLQSSQPIVSSSSSISENQSHSHSSNIPQGFFDNEREEMVANGLNVIEEIQKREISASETLQSFFEEVEKIIPEEDVTEKNAELEDEEEAEEKDDELNEEAVQLAYGAKIGNLMLRYDPNSKKDVKELHQLEEAAAEADEILLQDHEMSRSDEDGPKMIQRIVEKTLAIKKRKLELNDCEPLDLLDWTSKGLKQR